MKLFPTKARFPANIFCEVRVPLCGQCFTLLVLCHWLQHCRCILEKCQNVQRSHGWQSLLGILHRMKTHTKKRRYPGESHRASSQMTFSSWPHHLKDQQMYHARLCVLIFQHVPLHCPLGHLFSLTRTDLPSWPTLFFSIFYYSQRPCHSHPHHCPFRDPTQHSPETPLIQLPDSTLSLQLPSFVEQSNPLH